MTLDGVQPQPVSSSPRVLVVDTDAQNVRQLVAELRRLGCDPVEATSFEEAKRIWVAERPPMMVVDVCLGQFNGLQLLLRARADRPDLKAVITCAFPDKVLESETERFGATFLVKPLTASQIASVLQIESRSDGSQKSPSLVERRVEQRRRLALLDFAPERRLADRRRLVTPQ
jgi:DNA-binding NtrC family response regulator